MKLVTQWNTDTDHNKDNVNLFYMRATDPFET